MTDKEKSAIEIVRETSITIMKNGRKITLNNRELLAVFAKLVECGDISVIFHPPHCTTMLHHDDDDGDHQGRPLIRHASHFLQMLYEGWVQLRLHLESPGNTDSYSKVRLDPLYPHH